MRPRLTSARVCSPITKKRWFRGIKLPPRTNARQGGGPAISHDGRCREGLHGRGKDVVGKIDGAEQILRISRERFAPVAIDRIFQDMAKSIYFKRTGQDTDKYLAEFGMLREKDAARILAGGSCPDECSRSITHVKCCIGQKWGNLSIGSGPNAARFWPLRLRVSARRRPSGGYGYGVRGGRF